MLWDIAAVIGFTFLSIYAFIGVLFTWRAWVFSSRLAIEEFKHKKLKDATSDVALKIILTDVEKQQLEQAKKNEDK